MKSGTIILASCVFFSLVLIRCQGIENKSAGLQSQELESHTDSIKKFTTSSAAEDKDKQPERKFIRTADIKFKVHDVVRATYTIENIINNFGGFVTYTNLNSTVDNKINIQVSEDSSIETTYFTVANIMTLRVPNTMLDTTLKSIATLISYIDYRVIKADDAALVLLANHLTENRANGTSQRLSNAISGKGRKLVETTNAEDHLLLRQEQSDNAKLASLSLTDQVNFSTITLALYQRQGLLREKISNEKAFVEYTPGLGKKIFGSLSTGWEMLETLIVFFVQFWWVMVIGVIVVLVLKMYRGAAKKPLLEENKPRE